MDDISKLVLAILSSGAVGAIIAGLFQHRKLGADATEVITKAAASMVDTMQNRMDDQEGEITELKAKIKVQGNEIQDLREKAREYQAFRNSLTRRAARHDKWDQDLVEVVRNLDPTREIADPPSFFPET
jgi:anion-transporting  ArsA/GET3 family ATPase